MPADVDDLLVGKALHSAQLHPDREKFVRLKVMSWNVGIILLIVLLLSVAYLLMVNITINKNNGLALPSSKPAVNQMALHYVPTAFATVLETFWVLLNRRLCVFRPSKKLRSCKAEPSQSLDVNYASLPPQLALFWALRAKHLILATVCGIGLSPSILAVSPNGLFVINASTCRFRSLPGLFIAQVRSRGLIIALGWRISRSILRL